MAADEEKLASVRDKNLQLQREHSMWQQKLADQESKGKAFASEIRELRAQLEAVLKKVPPGVPPTIEVPDASTPGRQAARRSGEPLSPHSTCEVVRRYSDESVKNAESELDQVLQQLEEDTNLITVRVRTRNVFFVLILVGAVLCSPGLMLSLRSNGAVDIKEGTWLWNVVLAWEFAFESMRVTGRRYLMSALQQTACVLSPPPPAYKFNLRYPPLRAVHGDHIADMSAATPLVLAGEAALKVCAIGTSEQSFYRRDDCDGCLCAAGSAWIHYKDKRFFGSGGADGNAFCVDESQWKQCASSWEIGKYKPNFCWEFLWEGGRRTSGTDEEGPKVLVDSCALHGGCHVMIRRHRQWVVIKDEVASHTGRVLDTRTVGVAEEHITQVNKTLNLNIDIRGWGLPSSAQYLLKLGPHSAPAEWQAAHSESTPVQQVEGRRYVTWQLVSHYHIVGQDFSGQDHEMVSWKQHEWKVVRDDGSLVP